MAAADQDFARLIADEERRAERLIAVLRILVALALLAVFRMAVVNVVAPGNDVVDDQITLVRVTLTSYGVLGLVSLVLTMPRLHRRAFAYAFAAADVAFVLINISISLDELGLDGAYISALPTAWLAPLILSFNALRFSWIVQAYAGVLFVAGLWFVGDQVGGGRDGTLPQNLYMAFSGPPNVMRVAMLALVATILVLAVMRTRGLLRTALEQRRRRTLLSHYLPKQVAALVQKRDGAELRAGFDLEVVVMFVDIRDFTARAEHMPPDDVSRFLAEFRQMLRERVEVRGGMIDKFTGDGAMVVFGLRGGRKVAARDAIRCATEILAQVRAWSDRLEAAGKAPVRIGIGVHIGRAFVGAVGDDVRLEFTVVGDVVNTAARMEEATKFAGSPIVASEAVLAAGKLIDASWQPLPDSTVRGRTASVRAFALRQG